MLPNNKNLSKDEIKEGNFEITVSKKDFKSFKKSLDLIKKTNDNNNKQTKQS